MLILTIDPGSTSTKIGVWQDGDFILKENISHDRSVIDRFPLIIDQLEMRYETITEALAKAGLTDLAYSAVVGRGGLIRPVAGGTICVTDDLLKDLREGYNGQHASNLGGILAHRFSEDQGCPSFIVDPVVIDEMEPVATVSGLKGIRRKSIFHALNQKAVARRVATENGTAYGAFTCIVAHLGGGISVGLHKNGRVTDVNNALDGDGPMAPERTGGLPVGDLVRLMASGAHSADELIAIFSRKGGVYSYTGTANMMEIETREAQGDEEAALLLDALCYQVAKEIGALAAAASGKIDTVILTGGLAKSGRITSGISRHVSFIAPVTIVPGEFELEALTDGAVRVLTGEETPHIYRISND